MPDLASGLLLLTADRMFDGKGRVVSDAGVVLAGRHIEAVGERADLLQRYEGAGLPSQHYPGSTLLPGLIDTHSHLILQGNGDNYVEQCQGPEELLLLAAARGAWLSLKAGFTTVVDLGSKGRITFRLREAIQKGYIAGPRLILAGRPLTITGGHGWYLGGEVDGAEALRGAVRELCKEGADLIKVMATGGGTPGTDLRRPSYSKEELQAIAGEAHARNRRVWAHSAALQATGWLLDAGFDVICHGHFMTPDGRNDFDPRLAGRMVELGTYLNPTLETNRVRGDPHVIVMHPPEARQQRREEWQSRYDSMVRNFGRLRAAGVHLICGSDAGWGYVPFGRNYRELETMVAAGMGPAEALVSATGLAAAALGWDDRIGSLETGKLADLLVVNGDPAHDIRALRDVRAVWLEGQQVDGPFRTASWGVEDSLDNYVKTPL